MRSLDAAFVAPGEQVVPENSTIPIQNNRGERARLLKARVLRLAV